MSTHCILDAKDSCEVLQLYLILFTQTNIILQDWSETKFTGYMLSTASGFMHPRLRLHAALCEYSQSRKDLWPAGSAPGRR